MNPTILELRKKIDSIDDEILALLEQRAGHAQKIGDLKREAAAEAISSGKPAAQSNPNFYDPEREQSILKRLEKGSQAQFPKHAIPLVFREIMSACRSLEADVKVAYLGPSGTFTQIAMFQTFGHSVKQLEAPTIDAVFDLVSRGEAEYGVVPYENSREGGVIQTLDSLIRSDVMIRREAVLKIKQCLLSRSTDVQAIKRVYSHPAALAQCQSWLSQNLRGAELVSTRSTAAAAQVALQEEASAAIGSRLAGELLSLHILREGIQDQNDNSTRFVILSQSDAPMTGADRTTVALSLGRERGSLMRALKTLEDAGIAVARTESRASSHGLWQYVYFIDFEGHRDDPRVARAIDILSGFCEQVKILGSYPVEAGFGGRS